MGSPNNIAFRFDDINWNKHPLTAEKFAAWRDTAAHLESLLKLIPEKRIGQVEDIGMAAVFLASDDADYINGTTLFVYGGMTLYPGFEDNG